MGIENHCKLDIVVPTYNGAKHIPRLLESIKKQDFTGYRCIVIDDHSTDDTAGIIKNRFPWVELIQQPFNYGPAFNRNIAVRAGKSPYIAIFDDDTFLEDAGWLNKAIRMLEDNPGTGQIASKIVSGFDPDILLDCGICAEECLFGGIYHRQSQKDLWGKHEKAMQVLGACSAGTVLRRDAFERAGGFDPKYFYPVEDLDLSLRIHLAGFDVRYEPSLVTYHLESQAMGKSLERKMYMYRRNCLLALIENYPPGYAGRVLWKAFWRRMMFPLMTRFMEKVGFAKTGTDIREAKDYIRSFGFIMKNSIGILRKRKKVNRAISRPRRYLVEINERLVKGL